MQKILRSELGQSPVTIPNLWPQPNSIIWHNIQAKESTKQKLRDILRHNGIHTCLIYGISDELQYWGHFPKIITGVRKAPLITLTHSALSDDRVAIGQLNALLMQGNNSPLVRDLLGRFPSVTSCLYFMPLQRYILVLEGVSEAFKSTTQFTSLAYELRNELKDSLVFQIGPHHGAITTALARHSKKVTGIEISHNAVKNTELTLACEDKEIQERITLLEGDLSALKMLGSRCKFLFFNNPIEKGTGDLNSMAGNSFETPKRAMLLLSDILEPEGEAFLLAAHTFTNDAKENYFSFANLDQFLKEEMPGWVCGYTGYKSYPHTLDMYSYHEVVSIRRQGINSHLSILKPGERRFMPSYVGATLY